MQGPNDKHEVWDKALLISRWERSVTFDHAKSTKARVVMEHGG